jgi:hypothetical protein
LTAAAQARASSEGNMYANQVRRLDHAAMRGVPPHWAVLTVKCCVVGLLSLPLAVPVLLASTGGLEPQAEQLRQVAFFLSAAVWLGMFACAQFITTTFPPVPRR